MSEQELLHLLALTKVEGVGDVVAKKLILQCGSAQEIFATKSSKLANIDGIGSYLIQNLKNKTIFEKAEKELRYINSNNINVKYFQDSDYPDKLKHCLDGPIMLFTSGDIALNQKK